MPLYRVRTHSAPVWEYRGTVNAGAGTESLGVPAHRVLLVEDEREAGDALTECLQQLGCEVVAAQSVADGLRLVADDDEVFDVAILDLELPDGNGLDLVAALRSRSMPCVSLVLTAHDEIEWVRKAAAVGVAGFLRKPVSARVLAAELAKALDRSREIRGWLSGDFDSGEAGEGGVVIGEVTGPLTMPGATRTPAEQVALLSEEFGLTSRQAEALSRVGEGCRDREIADMLGVSYSRVRQLLAAGFGKLGVKSRNDFIRFLIERQKT